MTSKKIAPRARIGTQPPNDFACSALHLTSVEAGSGFYRIHHSKYANSLGFGKNDSRFSDPRRLEEARRFGVVYTAGTPKQAFVETIIRDKRDGVSGDLLISEASVRMYVCAEIQIAETLRCVDLRKDAAIVSGVPSDVHGASDQSLARLWSLAFYEHPDKPDGVIYPSRLNGEPNLVVYDRALHLLRVGSRIPLIEAPELPAILDAYSIALV